MMGADHTQGAFLSGTGGSGKAGEHAQTSCREKGQRGEEQV